MTVHKFTGKTRDNVIEPPDGSGGDGMELTERVIKLEIISEATIKSLDRLERSVENLQADVDRKFTWMISTQIGTLLAIIAVLAKAAKIY